MVLIHRWSLYTGSIAWKVYLWGLVKCGLCKQVVFICRWSLEQVDLIPSLTANDRFVFAGLARVWSSTGSDLLKNWTQTGRKEFY